MTVGNPPTGSVENTLHSPGRESSMGGDGEAMPVNPLATFSEVFSFMPDLKTKLYFGLGAFCATVSGCIFPAMLFLISKSFAALSGATSEDSYLGTIREQAYSFMVLGAIAFVLTAAQTALLETSATHMTNNFKLKWFRALLHQDMAYYDLQDISGIPNLVSSNAIKFHRGVFNLGGGIHNFVTVLLSLIFGFWSSWQVSLLVLAGVLFRVASATFLVQLFTSKTQRANSSYTRSESIVYTTISSFCTIFSVSAVEIRISKYMAGTQTTAQYLKLGLANGYYFSSLLLWNVAVALYGPFLLYGNVLETGCDPSGSSLDNATCEPVSAVGVFGAILGIIFAGSVMRLLIASKRSVEEAQSAIYRALEPIERNTHADNGKEAERDEKSQALESQASSVTLPNYWIDSSSPEVGKLKEVKGEIEFHGVHFAYPSHSEVEVFQGLSLKVPAGKTVAIVGAVGGGASATIHLLERFYDVCSGSITLDGVELRSLNLKWLREQIGLVSQEPTLFAQSIRNNIAIRLPGATQEQIEEAARKANAHDFIMSFPNGYDTLVGGDGAQFSRVQKQRIALARVLIRKPKILLLDQATRALDSDSEAAFQESLDVLIQERNQTVIIIADRLSAFQNADLIAVIKEGRAVETGTHDELMDKRGAYFDLLEAQTRGRNCGKKKESTVVTSSSSSQTMSNPPFQSSSFVDESNHIGQVGSLEDDVGDAVPVLRFRDVHFHYPRQPENKIFRELNLSVREGETLAIVVAPSGQGKSTLIELIEVFYHPTKGSVEFRGVNMNELNVHWVRDQLSLVSQEPVLFDSSIGENIRFGSVGEPSQEDVEWAAKEANAHDFIMGFPDGYDTQVGPGSSTQISGGQKQCIAIARALLRKPKLLLLDKATSALDSESEQVVREALDKIMAAMFQSTLVISDRLSTIRNAHRIAVIHHGKLRELGSHDELMALPNGRYRRLHDLQTVKEKKEYAERARVLAQDDRYYLLVGNIGATLLGLMFPAWGFIFAAMVQILYYRIDGCDESQVPPIAGYENCQDYLDDVADYMQTLSFEVFYGLFGLMVLSTIGHILIFYGFGTATERAKKRIRDETFSNRTRQAVSYSDLRSVGNVTSQLAYDVTMIDLFKVDILSCRFFGPCLGVVVVPFFCMWPLWLLFSLLLPCTTVLGKLKSRQSSNPDVLPPTPSGRIMEESLLKIRTVASLTIEEERMKEFQVVLDQEEPHPVEQNLIKGSTSGILMLVLMWVIGLMFWLGGWSLFRFPEEDTINDILGRFDFIEMLRAIFVPMFSFIGLVNIKETDLATAVSSKQPSIKLTREVQM